jgi:CDP-diacylglycerol--serine O-phosphatidyltransferase
MRHYVHAANLATSGNLVAGFVALALLSDGHTGGAAAVVLLGAAFDAIDGPLARRAGTQGRFGENLDSLADLVTFGVVPAYALFAESFGGRAGVGTAVGSLFVVCAAWRLARFPLCKSERYFVGCPVPVAGMTLAATAATGHHPALALIVASALSGLMVGTLRVPTLGALRRARASVVIDWGVLGARQG